MIHRENDTGKSPVVHSVFWSPVELQIFIPEELDAEWREDFITMVQ